MKVHVKYERAILGYMEKEEKICKKRHELRQTREYSQAIGKNKIIIQVFSSKKKTHDLNRHGTLFPLALSFSTFFAGICSCQVAVPTVLPVFSWGAITVSPFRLVQIEEVLVRE